jgi:hypothetical protein
MGIFYKKTISGPNGSITKVDGDPIKAPSTADLAEARRYSDAHKEEMEADARMAREMKENEFNNWADAVEKRMGNGYKMNRGIVRDNAYRDPRTKEPYSVEQGYNTFNRIRAKDNYVDAYRKFYSQNNIPINGGIVRKAHQAFYKDYPEASGQTYSEYKPLPVGKVAMYEDPHRFQKQRIDWIRKNATK